MPPRALDIVQDEIARRVTPHDDQAALELNLVGNAFREVDFESHSLACPRGILAASCVAARAL
jgi:hypothetical protein